MPIPTFGRLYQRSQRRRRRGRERTRTQNALSLRRPSTLSSAAGLFRSSVFALSAEQIRIRPFPASGNGVQVDQSSREQFSKKESERRQQNQVCQRGTFITPDGYEIKNRKQSRAYGKRDRNRKERSAGRCEQYRSHCHDNAKNSDRNANSWVSGSNGMFPLCSIQIPFPHCDAHAIERTQNTKEQQGQQRRRASHGRRYQREFGDHHKQRPCRKQKSNSDLFQRNYFPDLAECIIDGEIYRSDSAYTYTGYQNIAIEV